MAHNEICVAVRDQAGNTVPLQQVSIWTDANASIAATIYASATATSAATNPTTTDSAGILHVWSLEDDLWYTTPLQQTPLRLPVLGRYDNEELNVKDFGAMGDAATDDTNAFVAAIAAQKAVSDANYARGEDYGGGPWIYIPAGTYVVKTGALVIDYRGAKFRGDGRNVSVIAAPDGFDEDIMFEITGDHPFQTVLDHDTWQGSKSQNYEFRDLTITTYMMDQWTRLTARTGVGIQDNGVGGGTTWNLEIRGFQYGFASPYGHDFGYHYNLSIFRCDYGLYLGPGSEQTQFYGLNVGICWENIILEGVRNVMFYGVNTASPKISDIVFTGGLITTPTRMGVTRPAQDACYSVSFYDLWEEEAWEIDPDLVPTWNSTFNPPQFISFEGDGWSHRNIYFYNTHMSRRLLEEQSATGNCWIRMPASGMTACSVYFIAPMFVNIAGIEHCISGGAGISYGTIVIERPCFESFVLPSTVDWWWDGGSVPLGFKVQSDGGVLSGSTDMAGQTDLEQPYTCRINKLATNGGGWEMGVGMTAPSGAITFGYTTDLGANMVRKAAIDPYNGYLYLGDVETDDVHKKICFSDAEPTSGHWHVGDIIFHSDAAPSGYVGWICTTAGTGGAGAVFKTFGAISA